MCVCPAPEAANGAGETAPSSTYTTSAGKERERGLKIPSKLSPGLVIHDPVLNTKKSTL